MSKRVIIDKATRNEAEALGGPAVVTSLLSDGGSQGGEGAAATAVAATDADAGGWVTGSQLKAFEKDVQGRCVLGVFVVVFRIDRANQLASHSFMTGEKRRMCVYAFVRLRMFIGIDCTAE